jgi:hypothetical protein
MQSKQVGIIKQLYLYPVKSMGDQAVDEAMLTWHGLVGDRKYAFVQDGDLSHFPWLTAREAPQMLQYLPFFADPTNRAKSPILVKTPTGETLPLESQEVIESLSKHFPGKFHLIHLNIGTFDGFPISLISSATLQGMSERVGFPAEANRFRPNLVVEPLEPVDGIEDQWVGSRLAIGSPDGPTIAVSERDQRCVMVNYDRQTLKQTSEMLKEIAQNRNSCLGVYGSVIKMGNVKVGDPIFLI